MKKLTNVLALEMVLAMAEDQANHEIVKKLEKTKTSIEKKSNRSVNGEKKPTKAQLENIELAQQLKELLTTDFQAQKDLQAQLEIETSQKMTAIVKILINEGVAIKETVKRVSMVKLAD